MALSREKRTEFTGAAASAAGLRCLRVCAMFLASILTMPVWKRPGRIHSGQAHVGKAWCRQRDRLDCAIASLARRRSGKPLSAVISAASRRSASLALAALLSLLAAALPASAGREVVLKLKDGDIEVAGELRSFDGLRWVIAAHGFGELALEASRFDCISGACGKESGIAVADAAQGSLVLEPQAAAPATAITIAAAPPLDRELLPSLVRAYARHLGGAARQLIGAATDESRFRIRDAHGLTVAEFRIVRRPSEMVISDLTSGRIIIGATTRGITAAELAALAGKPARAQITDNEMVLGLDGLAVVVAQDNPAQRLGSAQLARIFSGEARDWSAFGLGNRAINVIAGTDASLDGLAAIARPRGLILPPATTRIGDEAELSDSVARDPGAIGLVSVTQLRNARALDIELSCGIVARPSEFAIKAEEYPLARRIYLYTDGKPKEPLAQEFVRFAGSRAGQAAVREGGLIDQSVSVGETSRETERIGGAIHTGAGRGDAQTLALGKRLAAETAHARRLPLTFRFAIASSELDAKSRGDIDRLAELVRDGGLKGRTIMLAGYTDAAGKPQFNAELSLRRATQIREALLKTLPDRAAAQGRILVRGFGPAAPVACNGGSSGQFRNRRVEVWLLDEDGGGKPEAGPVAAVPGQSGSRATVDTARRTASGAAGAPGGKKQPPR